MQNVQPLDRERAYREIAGLIAESKLDPGDPVTERCLYEQLGIGRTPVREAIRELVRDGVIGPGNQRQSGLGRGDDPAVDVVDGHRHAATFRPMKNSRSFGKA